MTQPLAGGSDDQWAIGFDVGGTKIAVGVVAGNRIIHRQQIPVTPDVDAALPTVLADLARDLRVRYPAIAAIGVGAAGMIDWPTGHIRWAPNNTYCDLPLRQALASETGLPIVVENDANAAAWAEARAGVGVGHCDIIVLSVGTGIGGGIILNGALQRGQTGIGGEVGHLIVNPDRGHRCGCGATGCLEAMASGTALGRLGRAAAAADPGGMIAALADGGRITGETVFCAASHGDQVACQLFAELGYWLGIGIASLVALYDPELVVITGGLVATGELLLDPTRTAFERFVFARDRRSLPAIVPAQLGADAGIIGAALLSLEASGTTQFRRMECHRVAESNSTSSSEAMR
ncbi:MAG: ROK family protein [Streptosporangiaceae bacterium]|nr:ROK family protein [Streptosporangiaceae bacterium]